MTGDLQAFLMGVYRKPHRRSGMLDVHRAYRQWERAMPRLQLSGWGFP